MTEYRGRLNDGKTAASREVVVTFGRAVEIRPLGGGPAEIWALHRLTASTPLKFDAHDALVRSADHPGATLLVSGTGVAKEILKLAPQLSAGSETWRFTKPLLLATAVILALAGCVYFLDLSPAKAIARMLPDSLRIKIGDATATALAKGLPVCGKADGRKALDGLISRLTATAGETPKFRVDVSDTEIVNAFAVPGERIVVSRGLIEKAENPDEVAGVIAHEMGHGIERHPETGIVRALGMVAAMEVLLSGSSGTLTNLGATLLALKYSRDAEHEADLHAIRILKAAGISSKPFGEFFNRLDKEEHGDSKDAGTEAVIFATHPPSPERAKLATDAATYSATPSMSAADWQALRGICAK